MNKVQQLSDIYEAFCIIRVISTAVRTAWAFHPTNGKLALTAHIFVYCGTVIFYIVNLFLSQRLMRARHPRLGWSPLFTIVCPPIVVLMTVITVIFVIVASLQMSFATDPNILRIDRDIQIYVETAFTVFAFLPFLICLLAIFLPRHSYLDKFGAGRFRTKVLILMTSSALLTLAAGWHCGVAWVPPVLATEHPWYDSKACFYVFDFGIEIVVLVLYLVTRIDRRFYVPDGAKGPFSYSGDVVGSVREFGGSSEEEEKEAGARVTPWGNSFYLPTMTRGVQHPGQSAEGILEDIPENGAFDPRGSTTTLATMTTMPESKYAYYVNGAGAGGYGYKHHSYDPSAEASQTWTMTSNLTVPENLSRPSDAPSRTSYAPSQDGTTLRGSAQLSQTQTLDPEQYQHKYSMRSTASASQSSFLELDSRTGRWRLQEIEDLEDGSGGEHLAVPGLARVEMAPSPRSGVIDYGNGSQWTLDGSSGAREY